MKLYRNTTSYTARRRSRRGFTLVELITVLTILAILAAIAAGSVVGYIKKAKFDRNEANAITIYQAAQTAIAQMSTNGTIDGWVNGLIVDADVDEVTGFTNEELSALDASNETVSKVVSLTYSPDVSDKNGEALYNLLTGYFYDKSVFGSTITVEFLISATYGVNSTSYSAIVLSSFSSIENAPQDGLKWNRVCRGAGTSSASTDNLPVRDATYRFETSHVGYYNGTEASAKPQITSVFLPISSTYELDGHIVGPTVNPEADSSGYLFNLRNGETLDVIWSVFDDDDQLHELNFGDGQSLKIMFWNPDTDLSSTDSTPIATLTIDANTLSDVHFDESNARYVYERCDNHTITRASCDFLVDVSVKIGNKTSTMTFPLSITRVSGDGRLGCPDKEVGLNVVPVDYYSYSLSIDCMMIRSDDTLTGDNAQYRYGSERLFGNVPRNVVATIEGQCNYVSGVNEDSGAPVIAPRDIPRSMATRAIDDPAYFNTLRNINYPDDGNHTAYVYSVKHSGATNDDDDNEGNNFSGVCVVNTLFGDIEYSRSTDLGSSQTISGTVWDGSNGDAVISSFRHLYNIRWVGDGTVNYRIVRELNWYINKPGFDLLSDVRVFISHNDSNKDDKGYPAGVLFRSPVEDGDIRIVSFPAIGTLKANQTLSSMSVAGGTIYSINNVQMRAMSFITGKDNGYGLICKNNGCVYNIYTNNLNLVLVQCIDGSAIDYNSFCPVFENGELKITRDGTKIISHSNNDYNCVGGLIGYNNGRLGSDVETDVGRNTVCMYNCVVIGGQYSDLSDYATGGVVGRHDNKSAGTNAYGVVAVRGPFIVMGGGGAPGSDKFASVGGVIGDCRGTISARLIVDGNPDRNYASAFANSGLFSDDLSCVVAGYGQVGGAVGWAEGRFNAPANISRLNPSSVTSDPVTGALVFPELARSNYQIDVTLPSNSVVIKNVDGGSRCVGGAIGKINNCSGEYLSIRVDNNGYIITPDISTGNVGGAIGEDNQSTISILYINIVNGRNSVIGSTRNDSGPIRSGGAIGYMAGKNDDAHNSRVICINASNDGVIISGGSDNYQGTGGAIGGLDNTNRFRLLVSVVNNANSSIIGFCNNPDNVNKCYGVGGAIGGMGNKDKANECTTQITANSVVFAKNYGSITGAYHVGGTIGNAAEIRGKVYADNHGDIHGLDFVGGAVGRQTYCHYGTIQSILDGTEITGANFVGGSVGGLQNFQDNAVVTAVVRSDSSVTGTGSVIGGVCGDINVKGTGTGGQVLLNGDAAAPCLTVDGASGEAVGGAVGIIRAGISNSITVKSADQTPTNRLIINVRGTTDVGGSVGILRATTNGDNNNPYNIVHNNTTNTNIYATVIMNLHPESYVYASGSNAGGAVGYIQSSGGEFGGRIRVDSSFGSSNGGAYIRGERNVGGAVGHFGSSAPKKANDNSGIIVNLDVIIWTIEGTGTGDANVGGAVGFFDDNAGADSHSTTGSDNNQFPLTVNLGSTVVTSVGHNVGGAIGCNRLKNGIINVTMAGTVSGEYRVGGAIGYNQADINEISATILGSGVVVATGNIAHPRPGESNVYTDPSSNNAIVFEADVGGAVGCNWASVNKVTADVSGHVKSQLSDGSRPGSNVGGAIGFTFGYYNNNTFCRINEISSTIRGVAHIEGDDNVGGAVGLNLCNVGTITSEVTGSPKIIGDLRVGGAVGFASGKNNVTGDNMLKGQGSGCIDSVTATISADLALQGRARIGGAIGQVGNKWGINEKYISAAVKYVEAVLNSAYLFDPVGTGTGTNEDACIGGVIGIFMDGRVTECRLSGTGGSVDTANSGINYPCPAISSTNTVMIAARGCSLGGIVGQIGLPNYQQNVCLSKISSSGTVRLCVVSMNGADRIGGWIGSGYAAHGGIGNNRKSEWNNNNTKVTLEVNNVMMVFSTGSGVGGFQGHLDQSNNGQNPNIDNNNPRVVFAIINVDLNNALISGSSSVGGAFGSTIDLNYLRGSINVTLRGRTNIGDYCDVNGIYQTHNCYEAGGAIGSVLKNRFTPQIDVPVNVIVQSNSRICADGTPPATATYGVGGAFGRSAASLLINYDGSSKWEEGVVRVLPAAESTPVYIYSKSSDVGGAVGVIINGDWTGTYSDHSNDSHVNATVRSDSVTASAGGFVGRMINGKLNYTSFEGSVTAAGSATGGFAGTIVAGTIEYCYTTALVNSTASNVGGFVGSMSTGTIKNSYVGGHTFEGRYIPGEGNITGAGNVGGFVGSITGNGTIEACYTTASVYGSAANIGGFIGSASSTCFVKNSYCTGLVSFNSTETSIGMFAGSGDTGRFTSKNRVIPNINAKYGGPSRFIGTVDGNISTDNIGFMTYSYNDDQTAIVCDLNDGTYAGHSYDSALQNTNFPIKARVNNEHYGDWPLPVTEGIPITDDDVFIANDGKFEYRPGPLDLYLSQYITVTVDGDELERNTDYTITYRGYTGVGYVSVVIAAKSGSRYSGMVTRQVEIQPIDITNASVTLNPASYPYTGAAIDPTATVTVTVDGTDIPIDIPLVYNVDYIFEYQHSTPAYGNDHTRVGTITVTAVGIGNFTGSSEAQPTFEITPATIVPGDITLVSVDQLVYNGEPQHPTVIVRHDGRTLEETVDYTLEFTNDIHASVEGASVTVTGTGNYLGECTVSYSISRATNDWTTEPSVADWTWGTTPSAPVGQAEFGYDVIPGHTGDNFSYAYFEDEDCTIPISDISSMDIGSYYAKFWVDTEFIIESLPEHYDDFDPPAERIVRFTIKPADISGAVVTLVPPEPTYEGNPVYTGQPIRPSITVTLNGRTLREGTDYELVWPEDVTNPGDKTVIINGIGNYSGQTTGSYTIVLLHTVTFETNGGTPASPIPAVQVPDNQGISAPATEITLEGHRFDAWCSDSALEHVYPFGEAVTSDLTLYARWVVVYTIDFDVAGGSSIRSQTVDRGALVQIPEDPRRDYYDFGGWFYDSGCTSPVDFTVPIYDNYTFHALWTPKTYNVSFVTNCPTAVGPQSVTYPGLVSQPELTWEDHTLTGWYTDEAMTSAFDFAVSPTTDVILYAKWEEST